MQLFGGIDIGSTTTELIIINEEGQIVYNDKVLTSGNIRAASEAVYQKFLEKTGGNSSNVKKIVATGYGRKHVTFANANVTEITCYAKGANFLEPSVRTVIDIGGQDSKVITVLEKGDVDEFVMNDKCAAGTGRFLEMVAKIFNKDVGELGDISETAQKIVPISSICAVFAESEIISLVSQEVKVEDIINSIHNSIGEKILGMSGRLNIKPDIMFCGGVARNKGMVKTIKRHFKTENVIVPNNSDFVGALGAAVIASGR